ncbi:uncharacterized protein [Elaeis guineensis]|uniref:uncharacterized protein n=1 Tax=Elaeis guineensis var. tenera TaxID=51953 RepID=UPI003C6D16D1
MSGSPSLSAEKKRWWLSNRKIVDKYVRDARSLIATQEPSDVSAAVALLDAALALSPRLEVALELKARSLLFLRRYREVADMLQDYIPSYKVAPDSSSSSLGSSAVDHSTSQTLSRERANLLSPDRERSDGGRSFRCFSISDLKRKFLASLSKSCEKEDQWRYLVLGQACCHLGLMEDAMVLLQTGRRLASAAFRRESVCWSDDSFTFSTAGAASSSANPPGPPTAPPSESESASHLLTHIKLLLRRRAAALAALDAGIPAEAIRHFSKILDSRRGVPHAFAGACFIGRAAAYRAAGRLAEAIADCNRALALDLTSIPALRARADLFEAVRSLPDCLRDLDHLKLLYDSILRDRKLPGPPWRPHHDVRYRDVPASHRALNARIHQLRARVAAGEVSDVDYYALIGVRRGCTRSELERAHLLLSLKHKPDKAGAFVDRLEFADDHRDLDAVRDQSRMSALILYRLLQKGYARIMAAVMDEEANEKQRAKEAATAAAAAAAATAVAVQAAAATAGVLGSEKAKVDRVLGSKGCGVRGEKSAAVSAFQGVFCRDLAVVGSLLSQVGLNRAIPVKYEALSC